MFSLHSTHWLVRLLGILSLALAAAPRSLAEEVKVTVLVVLATSSNSNVEAELKEIADRVQKQEPKLTGFRSGRQTSKTLKSTDKDPTSFLLVADQVVTVKIETFKKDKIQMTIKPPTLGEITYTTCCDKFFPIVTRYETKDKERLIIAIMVESAKK
ncbi:MAG: hypothetical protein K2R98_07875 [Gemmataceae bacterium]|nr:hypothetical protein [Gemmataceae bacterium]